MSHASQKIINQNSSLYNTVQFKLKLKYTLMYKESTTNNQQLAYSTNIPLLIIKTI